MAEPLATTVQLAARLPFVMDEDEEREATGALIDLSDEARHWGSSRWETETDAPYPVVNLILKAAARHMKNPDGFTQSRAGDEMVSWSDRREESGGAVFTESERKRLSELGGYRRSGFHSVGLYGWQRSESENPASGYVPVEGSDQLFPLYASDGPWP